MKKRKVFKRWVDYLLSIVAVIGISLAVMNTTEDFTNYILGQAIFLTIAIIPTLLLRKYGRDYLNED